MRASPDNITRLHDDDVFVFGSNEAGRHGMGAALTAKRKFGAQQGVGAGPTGRCYAIPTKNGWLRALTLRQIGVNVKQFLDHARSTPDKTFLVTEIGCGLAGYEPKDIAPMFKGAPDNVHLPASFIKVLGS